MYSYYPGYFDWTYLLILIGALLSFLASANVRHTFERYAAVPASAGLDAEGAARFILSKNGIGNVEIRGIPGDLTDNYVPSQKILNLSDSTRHSSSIAAIGVAAHECGHAIQDAVGFYPLILTRTISPLCAFMSRISIPLILFGFLIGLTPLIQFGILAFIIAISFQIITLPVEFDASRRAVKTLRENHILSETELRGVKAVLTAAALTYVAAAASSLLQLLRLLILSRNRDRGD